MGMVGVGTESYLFVNGLSTSKPLPLHNNITLCPAKSSAKWDGVLSLFENDIDFSIAVLSNATISSQLYITAESTELLLASTWNAQWDCVLLGALLNCNTMCNLQCDQALENIEKASYLHVTNYELRALLSPPYCLSGSDEAWLSANYERAYKLLEIDTFQTAVHAMASYRWHSVPRVQLAILWSGIESLFNVNAEVSFRISLYIANFLSDDSEQADKIFKKVKKLYSARSTAVHGNKTKDSLENVVHESAELLNQILMRCAERSSLPNVEDLVFRVN